MLTLIHVCQYIYMYVCMYRLKGQFNQITQKSIFLLNSRCCRASQIVSDLSNRILDICFCDFLQPQQHNGGGWIWFVLLRTQKNTTSGIDVNMSFRKNKALKLLRCEEVPIQGY